MIFFFKDMIKCLDTSFWKYHIYVKSLQTAQRARLVSCLSDSGHVLFFLFLRSQVPGNRKQIKYQWKHKPVYKGKCHVKEKRRQAEKRTLEGGKGIKEVDI